MSLLSVEEAQARMLAMRAPLAEEQLPLPDVARRYIASDVLALRDQPAADLSAMDGYAIRFDDLPGPWRLTGESAAGGIVPSAIGAGEAARIFTGAPLPPGSDTVILQEDAVAENGAVSAAADAASARGRHVRARASDFAAGSVILPRGARLSGAAIGLAALAGHGALPVGRRVRIGLLATGSELVPVGVPVPAGRLPSSNSVMLGAMLAEEPVDIIDLGIAGDDLATIRAAFDTACAANVDLVVTTGGASVGDHDLVKPALEAAGGTIDFWKIAMRPGKPLVAGTLGEALFVGLPGNPVSAFVTATLFLMPLVRHLAGSSAPLPSRLTARAGSPLAPVGKRDDFLRAVLADGVATPVYQQDSAALHALSLANCLIHRRAGDKAAETGDMVTVIPLSGS